MENSYLPQHIAIVDELYKENSFAAEDSMSPIYALGVVISECLHIEIPYLTVNFPTKAIPHYSEKDFSIFLDNCVEKLCSLLQKKNFFIEQEKENTQFNTLRTLQIHNNSREKKLIFSISCSDGRRDILHAVKTLLQKDYAAEEITEKAFLATLPDSQFPEPDYIIVTGKEKRFPDFRILQSAYSEYFFTQTPLCGFTGTYFQEMLADFAARQRNFGK